MAKPAPLRVEALYRRTDLDSLDFETTEQLSDLAEIIGQPRAIESVQFGTGIQKAGYNIFALGPAGSGKRSLVTRFFQERAAREPVPDDWIYVHNFEVEHKPNAVRLPAGLGLSFQRDMARFIEDLTTTLPAAFESDEYRARRRVVEEEIEERQAKAFEEMQQRAKDRNMALLRTPGGLVFAPVKDGEVMPPEEFQKLPQQIREEMEKQVAELQEELQKMLQQVPAWQREIRQKTRELDREVTAVAVANLLGDLRTDYAPVPEIAEFLDSVEKDIIESASRLLSPEGGGDEADKSLPTLLERLRQGPSPFRRYQVNLLVDHHATKGAPVIYEDNPTFQDLTGRIEREAQMGALVTDFTLIKPGALHLANGGYLILDARKVLLQPNAWETLKRALGSRHIKIESLGQMLGLMTTVSLEPEPIPLDIKVALLGDRLLYYLLAEADPEFNELFKVQADFAETMARTGESQELYARVIATLVRKRGLKPFNRRAVATVIEHASRRAEDAEKLSAQIESLSDLLCEADYWAGENGGVQVSAEDIQKAIDAKVYRSDQIRERMQESILRDFVMIATSGEEIGQLNGLSVLRVGDFTFGVPSRITARVRRGKGEVVNIEREVELSGPIHSKGVMILSSFLGARYGAEQPLSLAASLVFEQSYSGVEGDSASSAELYALLSALSEVPIRQALAVTGSVSQYGQVQAIGGVNEKIEGFFDICKARGLTGEQGVLIPIANVKNLMLKKEVRDATAAGQFLIYPVATIDEGIELLTGLEAGELDENGEYPPESINGRVRARLKSLQELDRELERESNEASDEDGGTDAPANRAGRAQEKGMT